ncbi:hypothetical protein [Bradyrhizobium sp. JYMT SZCCT0428]|uniref:hypothetical protein n=1 Tax=Bradyrhizobium sp. JYMT SZCCT0428 TaxID=2807673 RepID=UPI001BAA4003|nr:hypothetical protein [Bradyrhizobium sp. JYMT SZCCT0428]
MALPVARLAILTHATPAGAAGQQASWIEFPAATFRRAANRRKTGKKTGKKTHKKSRWKSTSK